MPEDLYVLGERHKGRPLPGSRGKHPYLRFIVMGTTTFLLMGQGEAILAAPVLVPALWWVYRWSKRWGRIGSAFLAGLVMIETSWYVVYFTAGENAALMIATISIAFAGTLILFWKTGTRREHDAG
jgi:hypothetical protein